MKAHELKHALGRIRPDDALVNDTIERIRLYKTAEKTETREASRLSFAMRLAPSLCALALLAGVFFTIDKTPLFPSENAELPDVVEQRGVATFDIPVGTDIEAYGVALVGARSHTVSTVSKISSCYFLEVSQEEAEQGIMYSCAVQLTPISVTAAEGVEAPDEGQAILARAQFGDDKSINDFVSLIGGTLNVELFSEEENGETVWYIESCAKR